MNANLQGFVAPRPSLNATLDTAHAVVRRLGVLGIPSQGIFANPTIPSLNAQMTSEADIVAAGAQPSDALYYQVSVAGNFHDVAGVDALLRGFDGQIPVGVANGIYILAGDLFGQAAATSQALTAISNIQGVKDALTAALA